MRYLYAGVAGAVLMAVFATFEGTLDVLGKTILSSLALVIPWVIICLPDWLQSPHPRSLQRPAIPEAPRRVHRQQSTNIGDGDERR